MSARESRAHHTGGDYGKGSVNKRLSWLSSVVSLFHDLKRAAAPQGWRCAPPPSAASALTRPGPFQRRFWTARYLHSRVFPWCLLPDDCIEDAKEASHACDQRDLLWASAFDQTFVVLADD